MKNYVISLVESKNSHTGSIWVRPKGRLVLLKCINNFFVTAKISLNPHLTVPFQVITVNLFKTTRPKTN